MTTQLGEGVLPTVLRDLYLGRRTGMLIFVRGKHQSRVCFIRGHIVWGDSNEPECRLGPVLVRHGIITQATFEEARHRVGAPHRLGEVLTQQFGLEPAALDNGLAIHVREILLAVFTWRDATYAFDEYPPEAFARYDRPLAIPTGDLILDAVWSVSNPDVVRYAIGGLDRRLRLSSDPLLRYQRLALNATDAFVVSRIDGSVSPREILALVPLSQDEVLRSVFGLLCTGVAEWVHVEPEPAPADPVRLPSREEVLATQRELVRRTHFEVLGLGREATFAEIEAAASELARRFHPDGHHDPSLAELLPALEEIFARVNDAHRVLSHPARRAEYERTLKSAERSEMLRRRPEMPATRPAPAPPDPMHVESLLARAAEQLEQGIYWDAQQTLESIQGPLTKVHDRQRRLLLARVYMKNPKWMADAKAELMAITAEDPSNAEAYFLLGQIYKRGGVTNAAAAMFRQVLELKPRHAGARSELAALETTSGEQPAPRTS